MTKKHQQMLWQVTHSNNESLYDVYTTFSDNKRRAYDYCRYEMHRKDGFNFRITSANTFCFLADSFTMTPKCICIAVTIPATILTTL